MRRPLVIACVLRSECRRGPWRRICKPAELDQLEVASLLHDVGKIGVPDVDPDASLASCRRKKSLSMERQRQFGARHPATLLRIASDFEISCVTRQPGSMAERTGFRSCRRSSCRLAARMLAIVDAFDAMTTDHVYRRAMSARTRDRGTLRRCGHAVRSQLIEEFCGLVQGDLVKLTPDVARRWLREIRAGIWPTRRGDHHVSRHSGQSVNYADLLFHQKLLDAMHDGVIFVDMNLQIVLWNRGIERLTGIPAASALHERWLPSLLGNVR